MDEYELGRILWNMYESAPRGHQVAHIHLFGIKYASIIKNNKCRIPEILKAAELNASYATEISKGMKLSEYVTLK